jgi:D-3-phosphoglycerate dehydrogenase
LAEKLGAFAGQIVDEGLDEVAIEYEGDVTQLNMKPLTAAALAGLLRPLLQDVNMVSAPALLKERGAPLTESTRDDSPTYDSLIRVKVKTGGGWRTLAGTLVASQPRIVEVKGMALEAPFHPLTLYTNNADKPGFIGALGTLLGDAHVNIATFHLGRDKAGGEAIALVGIDQPPAEAVMAKIKSLPHVRYAKLLRF